MIRNIDFETEKHELLRVIQESFLTVANDFNLTEANAPTNPAFLTISRLEESVEQELDFFLFEADGRIAGCIGIQPGKEKGEYYIERLAVLPEYRHRGIGGELLEFAVETLKKKGCSRIGIAIIEENTVLKEWYKRAGFIEAGIRKFEHLPFTVCFLGINIDN